MYVSQKIKQALETRDVVASVKKTLKPDLGLFGLAIHNQTLAQAVDWAVAPHDTPQTAVFVNVNSINLSFNDPLLKRDINQSDRVFADGSGVRLGARHLGVDVKENVNGTDLLYPLCQSASDHGRRIFLLGGEHGVVDKAACRLLSRFSTLQVAGVQHGYFDKKGNENQLVIEKINASGTDILMVGFGSPLQERWVAENKDALNVSSVLAVGGLFDFISGKFPRAPLWMRKNGIEWIWRLMQEPKTKFNRYMIGSPLYVARLWCSPKSHHEIAAQGVPAVKRNGLSGLAQRFSAILALAALSPVFLIFAMLVKHSSAGPVFYSQTRVGKHGRRFKFYKFRSMYLPGDPRYVDPSTIESDRQGVCKKFVDDPRVTSVGKFMRKYSIDELPQLLNVVVGDMLLIGPRPALTEEVDSYEHRMYQRFDVMPGLTGLWQVSGRADTTFEEQIDLDLSYVANRSWWQDVKILASTLPAVLLAKGAY